MGLEDAPSSRQEVDGIIAAAAWQDALLQSYRGMYLTVQSILLAVGIGVSVAAVSAHDLAIRIWCTAAVWVLGFVSVLWSLRMGRVVRARQHDVDYWHELAIEREGTLPVHLRFFIAFKVRQRPAAGERRTGSDEVGKGKSPQEIFLSAKAPFSREDIRQLIGGGHGMTREILDTWVFLAPYLIWSVLAAATVAVLVSGVA